MAEMVLQTQCRSGLRQAIDVFLDVTFPVWGLVSPLASVFLSLIFVSLVQQGRHEQMAQLLPWLAACVSYSIVSLSLKRVLTYDTLTVDKRGIKLPCLMGSRLNIKRSIPWSQVNLIQSVSSSNDLANSKIVLRKAGGGDVDIPINQLKPEFVEQFLLACKMWAQNACDLSLEQLQNNLRIEAHSNSSASYTDLWEEELGRRFCPTAFIPLEPGRALRNNSLKVISQLATGGLSALYLCQLEGKQLVVLKESMIPASSEAGVRDKAKELFEREAQLLMKIDHPGIVHILDCFAEGDRNYMLLEYINGVDLRQLVLQNGGQKEIDVIEWAIQIATTLKYLHEKDPPLIHRDLTPDNVVLGNDGKVTIVDFGAANEFIGNATGTFVGKHAYIAPEQMRGKASTHSDIYAFGCTLNFLLTGQEPEALSPSIPREINPAVSEELSALVESCTQMEPNDRYQSVAQLLPVLRRLAAQSLVT